MATQNKRKRYLVKEQVEYYVKNRLQLEKSLAMNESGGIRQNTLTKYKSKQLIPKLTDAIEALVILNSAVGRYGSAFDDSEIIKEFLKHNEETGLEDYFGFRQEFVEDIDGIIKMIFTTDRMKELVEGIFGGDSLVPHLEGDPDYTTTISEFSGIDNYYRIKLASVLLERSARYLATQLEGYGKLLQTDLERAIAIADALALKTYEDKIGAKT